MKVIAGARGKDNIEYIFSWTTSIEFQRALERMMDDLIPHEARRDIRVTKMQEGSFIQVWFSSDYALTIHVESLTTDELVILGCFICEA